MANKKSNKKGQAAQQSKKTAAPAQAEAKKGTGLFKKSDSKGSKTASKKDTGKKASKAQKNAQPGLIARAKAYIKSVRSEMKRVTWPSKQELINYSVAVCVSLVVVGVAIALLDFVIGEGLVLFSGLRG